tara:strand:- start:684 stop:1130 length:447 start_codon:yes stop_codon:yes gene_type:complete
MVDSCKKLGFSYKEGGTYVCIEGPQFSSLAESNFYRSLGADIIGMTNMPEAKLAREAEICYSTLALSTDYDCWHEGHDSVTVDEVVSTMNNNVQNARMVISEVLGNIPEEKDEYIKNALQSSIISSMDSITDESKEKLSAIIRRYLLA